jgi:hypothetical protein
MLHYKYSWRQLFTLVLAAFALIGCGTPSTSTTTQEHGHSDTAVDHTHSRAEASAEAGPHVHGEEFELPHIHGLGFSADGKSLFIPAHVGVLAVSEGKWSHSIAPDHDYMGFAISNDGFYSSGHPAPASADLPNPLGLVKSTDGGNTLQMLGFAGESDFHLMAVGYKNHAIYVLNPAQNSKLSPGLHYSLDDGRTWNQGALQGISAAPLAIAAHPTDAQTVAIATEQGIMLSTDHGATFTRIGQATPVTAASFSPGGDLLFGSSSLSRYNLSTKQMLTLPAPPLVEGEFISYIAGHPTEPNTIALTTSERNVFQSNDNGQQWDTLASNGKGVNAHED